MPLCFVFKLSNDNTISSGGWLSSKGPIKILQIFSHGNMQNMAINIGLSVMHKWSPISDSVWVNPILASVAVNQVNLHCFILIDKRFISGGLTKIGAEHLN